LGIIHTRRHEGTKGVWGVECGAIVEFSRMRALSSKFLSVPN
jgi:hypothetical protein